MPQPSVGYCLSPATMSLPQNCVDYTGPGWTLTAIMGACSDGMAGSCPTMNSVGSCITMCGKMNETVFVFYSPTTAAEAMTQCQQSAGYFVP